MSNKSQSSLGRPPVIDLVSDTEDDEPSTSTNLISPMDTGYLKVDLTRLAKMEKNGKLSHVASFQALYHVLRSTGDSWLHDLQEPDWDKCIFTGHPGTLRPKAAELTSLQPPGNHVYFVGGAAVVEALLRTAQFFRFPDALIRRLKLCHPNYRPPPALLHASLTEGVPTVSSLTATSSSIDICCDTPHSERVELEAFLQHPAIALDEPVSHPNSTVWKGLPFVREFRRFQRMSCQQSSPLFQDFSHFFKELKRIDSRWRYHTFARSKIPDSVNRPSLVEEWINVYVRGNHNIPARHCFKGNMVEDFDFFVGENRLLQYCALRCLRLGDIALCKAIAKVRKDMFYPDYASNIDWDRRRSTPSSALSMPSRSSSSAAASCPQLSMTSSSSSSLSVSQHTERSDGAQSHGSNDAEARKLITQLLEEFSRPTPISHPSDIKDALFHEEFYHLHRTFENGGLNVSSFMDLYLMLREANDRWRFVTEQNHDATGQRASRKKGYVVEALDPAAVRVYCRRFGARASEYAKQQKDIDYFIGDDRLLQYVGMQTLQYGSLALASAIADIRERFRSGSFPLVSINDASIPATEESHTQPTTRQHEEATQLNEETTTQQQDATVLSKSRPLSPTTSERSRKRRRQNTSSQAAATSANHTTHTHTTNGHGDNQASTTLLRLQPPPQAPAKSASINTTRASLPQHVVMSDEDSDEIETQSTKPHKPPHEPHMTADSKPVPPTSFARPRLMSSKSRDNRNLTFCDAK